MQKEKVALNIIFFNRIILLILSGGNNYNGLKTCASGLNCVIITDYFSQCIPNGDTTCFKTNYKFNNQEVTPQTVDWRSYNGINGVSPVKNQGIYGTWYIKIFFKFSLIYAIIIFIKLGICCY